MGKYPKNRKPNKPLRKYPGLDATGSGRIVYAQQPEPARTLAQQFIQVAQDFDPNSPENIANRQAVVNATRLREAIARRAEAARNKPPTQFNANVKSVLLTWPKCALPPRYIMDQLKKKVGNYFKYATVCTENHALVAGADNPEKHAHAFLMLNDFLKLSGCRDFDLAGPTGLIYHPNIKKQKTNNPSASIAYVKKDGEFIEEGIPPCLRKTGRLTLEEKQETYKEIMKEPCLHKFAENGQFNLLQIPQLEKGVAVCRQSESLSQWMSKESLGPLHNFCGVHNNIPLEFNSPGGVDQDGDPVGRQVHHWISGGPDTGKSWAKSKLMDQFRAVQDDYHPFYSPDFGRPFQLIFMDEFVSQRPYWEINRLADQNMEVSNTESQNMDDIGLQSSATIPSQNIAPEQQTPICETQPSEASVTDLWNTFWSEKHDERFYL